MKIINIIIALIVVAWLSLLGYGVYRIYQISTIRQSFLTP